MTGPLLLWETSIGTFSLQARIPSSILKSSEVVHPLLCRSCGASPFCWYLLEAVIMQVGGLGVGRMLLPAGSYHPPKPIGSGVGAVWETQPLEAGTILSCSAPKAPKAVA